MKLSDKKFQKHILSWFDKHGRKNLPWQQDKTPYRVWVSEIMLQQTQVQTVIPYFQRFMSQFPTLKKLAEANEDAVLHLWSGLGYYNRARMLLRSAKYIAKEYQYQFPNTLDELTQLPGIGKSTAGAILSIAFNQPAPILDGNVKRVLSRFHAISEPINSKLGETQLWELATHYTPTQRVADYTQAIMDIGATLCTRKKPQCSNCPLLKDCKAAQLGLSELLPVKTKSKNRPIHSATFLIIKNGKKILLYKRPSFGIWGGLWSLPEIKGPIDEKKIKQFCQKNFQLSLSEWVSLNPLRHSFSHYHLDIFPILIEVKSIAKIGESNQQIWFNLEKPESIGLPKPIVSIINDIV